mgnify:CR=1 FL=1
MNSLLGSEKRRHNEILADDRLAEQFAQNENDDENEVGTLNEEVQFILHGINRHFSHNEN